MWLVGADRLETESGPRAAAHSAEAAAKVGAVTECFLLKASNYKDVRTRASEVALVFALVAPRAWSRDAGRLCLRLANDGCPIFGDVTARWLPRRAFRSRQIDSERPPRKWATKAPTAATEEDSAVSSSSGEAWSCSDEAPPRAMASARAHGDSGPQLLWALGRQGKGLQVFSPRSAGSARLTQQQSASHTITLDNEIVSSSSDRLSLLAWPAYRLGNLD